MLELHDYLGLSRDDARRQWRGMLARSAPPPGGRQDDFTPVETLLCFGLGLTEAPSPSGTTNIRESNPYALQIAALAKRSTGSLALKLANLDGRRANRAKSERDLWIALTQDDRLTLYMDLYETILRSARDVGIDETRLADFLGAESGTMETILQADVVASEDLRSDVAPQVREAMIREPSSSEIETERSLLGLARVGQKQFARAVLENCSFACVFCGLGLARLGLPPSRMLVASHIKAWRDSDNMERLDVRNGLAACPTHDAAFDGHLLTISPDMTISRSPQLERAIREDTVLSRNFGSEGMKIRIESSCLKVPFGEAYLEWHRARLLSADVEKLR